MVRSSLLLLLVVVVVVPLVRSQFVQTLKERIKQVISGDRPKDDGRSSSEEMMLFPNVAFQRKDGFWRLNVHGWRFRTSKRNKFFGESSSNIAERLARLVASSEQIVYYNDTFQRDRLKPFMVQDKKHEEIHIMIGTKQNFTTTTDDEGQFRTSFIIADEDVQEMKEEGQVITYRATGDNFDQWQGKIHLLERKGLSIISDIDDTIKISEVLDKIRLVANTFIHGFRVVEGMPEVYRQWSEKYNCSFHYLSAMPDQLYAVTKDFVDEQKFPEGSFHMRHFRWSSVSIFNFVHSLDTKMHKINHLRYFIFNCQRLLVLVGDSGERDPEIYGFIARKYPKRVLKIFIRAVKGEKGDDHRFIKAFDGVAKEKWSVFTSPLDELPRDLNIPSSVSANP